ncbi:MAG: hypothetical protein GYB65_03755 [Chloroflexi bacterium]|nr:hypothetical protein [Chloroflexota bacterium]
MRRTLVAGSVAAWLVLAAVMLPVSVAQSTIFQGTPTPDPDDQTQVMAQLRADYPRVDGSTSAYPLQMTIACHVYAVPCSWQENPFAEDYYGPAFDADITPELLDRLWGIVHSGTHGSYMNLIAGDADIILVAREPSGDELTAAADLGVDLDVRPVALDAFVFLLHVDNPIDYLTLDTIRAIYTGEMTTWAGAGMYQPGLDALINPYQRNPNSGSQELMLRLVMGDLSMINAPDMILPGMMGPINVVGDDPYGVGYSVYFYAVHINAHPNIKLAGIEGVRPTPKTIADWTYPLTTEVYVVVRDDMPPDSTTVLLRDWLLTEEGQAVVASSGYVAILPKED